MAQQDRFSVVGDVRSTGWIKRFSLALALIGPLLLASTPASSQPAEAEANDETADFSGAWDATYGLMELTQDGNVVSGQYSYGGGSSVEGTVEGRRLTFRYAEPTAAGDGWFELAEDGLSFSGFWREDGSTEWFPWAGQRSSRGAAMLETTGYAGLFDTTYGRLRLMRDGDRVVGSYTYSGGSTLEGQIEGDRYVFRYQEPDVAGQGWFELSEDHSAFNGAWSQDGSDTWNAWEGTRVVPESGRVWLVVLEAPWENSLAENEYSFGEMLRAYFERMPNVSVRHRRLYDVADFERAGAELAYLAEPVALLLASHGTAGDLLVNGERLQAEHFNEVLRQAPNVFLLHFSSCETMTNGLPEAIQAALPSGRRVAVSGYATSVDWSASALIEFLYLDLVLGRGLATAHAADVVTRELHFAGDEADPSSPLGAARFRFIE